MQAAKSKEFGGGFLGLAAVGGAAGGVVMVLWMMIYSAATNSGFWTPLNVCMASFVFRSDAQTMVHEMMMHPGMSMNAPVNGSHLLVGFVIHMAFSIVAGIAFALILLVAVSALRLPLVTSRAGYAVAGVIGALILYLLMMYAILPWANPIIPDATPRGAFVIGHVLFGVTFGLVAFALLHPTRPQAGTQHQAT